MPGELENTQALQAQLVGLWEHFGDALQATSLRVCTPHDLLTLSLTAVQACTCYTQGDNPHVLIITYFLFQLGWHELGPSSGHGKSIRSRHGNAWLRLLTCCLACLRTKFMWSGSSCSAASLMARSSSSICARAEEEQSAMSSAHTEEERCAMSRSHTNLAYTILSNLAILNNRCVR